MADTLNELLQGVLLSILATFLLQLKALCQNSHVQHPSSWIYSLVVSVDRGLDRQLTGGQGHHKMDMSYCRKQDNSQVVEFVFEDYYFHIFQLLDCWTWDSWIIFLFTICPLWLSCLCGDSLTFLASWSQSNYKECLVWYMLLWMTTPLLQGWSIEPRI